MNLLYVQEQSESAADVKHSFILSLLAVFITKTNKEAAAGLKDSGSDLTPGAKRRQA